jgi:hypothetical protein
MRRFRFLLFRIATICTLVFCSVFSMSQQRPPQSSSPSEGLTQAIRELRDQVRELRGSVDELRDECMHYRQETDELRRELGTRKAPEVQAVEAPQSKDPDQRLSKLEEDIQLLNGKADEQHQSKVESASRYRVRLSGIALFNLFSNRGNVDNIDNPSFALSPASGGSRGSFGGTLRQSLLGLEVFGPRLAGAKTSAAVQFDFAGGFSQTSNGVTLGLARLRTGVIRADWTNTTVVAGQDSLFFAPNAPTSFASLSVPALAYSGSLWAWTPQIRIEHRLTLSDKSVVSMTAGILDPLSGEPPSSEYLRQADAGERSGQPAYATHFAFTRKTKGQDLKLGAGAYYSRQNWGFDRKVNAWAALADWEVPLGRLFQVTGELYKGRAIGGLGGASGRSVLFNGSPSDPATYVHGLDAAGGWAQLKFSPTSRIEFNTAFGQDNPYAEDVRYFSSSSQGYFNPLLARNRGAFVNTILRPRSDLVLALEYRRLRSFQIPSASFTANHLDLSLGMLF